MGLRIGTDVGGTFTDIVIVSDTGDVSFFKTPSTKENPRKGIVKGLKIAAEYYTVGVTELLSKCEVFVHGATVATNAFLQRKGASVGLICTEGHRDTLYFRDGYKPDRFNLLIPPPTPLVSRYLRAAIEERVNYKGEVLVPLNEDSVVRAAHKFKQAGVEAIAVCLLWSFANPKHERRIREIIQEEMPGAYVLISSDVLPVLREWNRTSATVLSAYVLPGSKGYFGELEDYLQSNGYKHRLLAAQCSGGTSTIDEVLKHPVNLMGSGPGMGPTAGLFYAKKIGIKNFITIDMGGTSFDVCAVTNGKIPMTRDARVDDNPLGVLAVDVYSIGAGGGSIAWVDEGGALRVGPDSAGSNPGPACYGFGGDKPTFTDAALTINYLDPHYYLGGKMKLQPELSKKALTKVAEPLGMGLDETAYSIFEITCDNMAAGVKAISINRGLDPREYVLIAGGGAGPMVAWRIAQKTGIRRILIPRYASVFCAFGMVCSDLRHNEVFTFPMPSTDFDVEKVEEIFSNMEKSLTGSLENEGVPRRRIRFERSVDCRYVGQLHEVELYLRGRVDYQEMLDAFHRKHKSLYAYDRKEMPVEFFHWRCAGIGELAGIKLAEQPYASSDSSSAYKAKRRIYLTKEGFSEVTIYDGSRLQNGMVVNGPAVIELPTTTALIGQGQRGIVNKYGEFEISM